MKGVLERGLRGCGVWLCRGGVNAEKMSSSCYMGHADVVRERFSLFI